MNGSRLNILGLGFDFGYFGTNFVNFGRMLQQKDKRGLVTTTIEMDKKEK